MDILIIIKKENRSYFLYLFLTFGFFLQKGIIYATLTSFTPLITILIICVLFYFSLHSSVVFNRFILFWSTCLIAWSSARILLSLMHRYLFPLSESHVHHQLGIHDMLLSLTAMVIAIYFWAERKYISR